MNKQGQLVKIYRVGGREFLICRKFDEQVQMYYLTTPIFSKSHYSPMKADHLPDRIITPVMPASLKYPKTWRKNAMTAFGFIGNNRRTLSVSACAMNCSVFPKSKIHEEPGNCCLKLLSVP